MCGLLLLDAMKRATLYVININNLHLLRKLNDTVTVLVSPLIPFYNRMFGFFLIFGKSLDSQRLMQKYTKYKEGNTRPSHVNQTSLVNIHDKAGNKCYTQDSTDTQE